MPVIVTTEQLVMHIRVVTKQWVYESKNEGKDEGS